MSKVPLYPHWLCLLQVDPQARVAGRMSDGVCEAHVHVFNKVVSSTLVHMWFHEVSLCPRPGGCCFCVSEVALLGISEKQSSAGPW